MKEKGTSRSLVTGLLLVLIAVLMLMSELSFIMHWKEDMSSMTDPARMDLSHKVKNLAGLAGHDFGHFLVADLFGIASLFLVLIPAAFGLHYLADLWKRSLMRTTLVSLSATIVWGIFLSFAGSLLHLNNLLEQGLGGRCGSLVTNWSCHLFGPLLTGLFALILAVTWLYLCSDKFAAWICREIQKPEKEPERKRESAPVREEPVPEPVAPDPAPVELPAEEPAPQEPVSEGSSAELTIVTDSTLDATVQELKPIDNRLDPPDGLPKYKFPSIDLLGSYSSARHDVTNEELTVNNNKIRAALANYKISVDNVKAIIGPTVTLYKVYPSPGVQIAQIKRLQEDIAVSLNAKGVRIITLSDSVGIEVANAVSSIVPLKSLLNDSSYRDSKADLPVAIGYTITQKVKVFDLADAPHLLIAGATKQGKSVGLNVIVNSLLYSRHPSELKFVFIDPKMVEFSAYGELLKHYLAVLPEAASEEEERAGAIVKKVKDAERVLRSLCTEMDDRYELLAKAGANNIKSYNEKYKARKLSPKNGHRFLPYIVVVVDEYADLTMTVGSSPEARAASRSVTNSIIRLAQKGRASGLHVILATQRPSVDVISGLIKSNFPMRIAFRVASRTDSMTILDAPGAEKLIGRGDMLFSAGIDTERIQCAYIDSSEIEAITKFIGSQQGFQKCYNTPYYLPTPEEGSEGGGSNGSSDLGDIDERFEDAARLVVKTQKASTSYLQTRLGMGFAKAARVMGQLEEAGIVGPQDGAKPRQVLISDEVSLESVLNDVLK